MIRVQGFEELGGEDGGAACVVVDPGGRRVDVAGDQRDEMAREEAGDPAVLAVVGLGHAVVQVGHWEGRHCGRLSFGVDGEAID